DGRTPRQQITEAYGVIRGLEARMHEVLEGLRRELAAQEIELGVHAELTELERATLRDHYLRNIFPLVTPQSMDPAHPFPFISNLSLNLLVTLRHPDRSEEHTSELQSRENLVCRLLLEKKNY